MTVRNPRGGPVAFAGARLLDPATGLDQTGDLLVLDGEIADFGPRVLTGGVPHETETVDAKGLCLAPGLVDARVHLREPGEEHKETIATASDAAVAGGVTSLVGLPNTDPPIDDVSVLEFVARRAREVKSVKIYCHAAITRGLKGRELSEMGLLAEAGALGFTDAENGVGDAQVMRRALAYARTFAKPVIQLAQEPTLSAGGDMNAGEVATRLGLAGIPPVAEVMMIERDLRLVELTGGRYHVALVSTAAGVAAIRQAKERGLPVTCDTAPAYFSLNENEVLGYRTFAKLTPPLRTEADRQAVVQGLVDGTIDALVSDHAPHDQDAKRQPFGLAEPGIVGLETLLPLVLQQVHAGRLSLLAALGLITHHPADLLGIDAGRLKRGAAADLVLFDLDRPWKIEPDAFRSKSKNTLFENLPVQGRVVRTLVDGRTLYRLPV